MRGAVMQEVHFIVEAEDRDGRPFWRVAVNSHAPFAQGEVRPLTDDDLRTIPGMPEYVCTWKEFCARLTPRAAWQPGTVLMQQVGRFLWDHLLSPPTVRDHIQMIDGAQGNRKLRYVLELRSNSRDAVLDALPLELAFWGDDHLFRRDQHPALRGIPQAGARDVALPQGSHVLIVTAHDNDEERPTFVELAAHAQALEAAIGRAAWTHETLADATAERLHSRLRRGGIDLLYVVCHGSESDATMGQLSLRDRMVTGAELSDWLDDGSAATPERRVQLVMLTACSSAGRGGSTTGMAQHLARSDREGRVALGYRGPVGVDWAIRFAEQFFAGLAGSFDIDRACASARRQRPLEDPQWALPVLYARRGDVQARVASAARRPSVLAPIRFHALGLVRAPRSYFVAREDELKTLRAWLASPGIAAITAVEGAGGMGKTELALMLAAEAQEAGRPVLWLPVRGVAPRECLLQLIRAAEPGYRPADGDLNDRLEIAMRERLSGYGGLLVLDDVGSPSMLDVLHPGAAWNVLVTTRERNLRAGVERVRIDRLATADAVRLLSRVAWDTEEAPGPEQVAATQLAERLGGLPLAIEIAGEFMRHQLVGAQEYLDLLAMPAGAIMEDSRRIQTTLTRSLEHLGEFERRAFKALGAAPVAGLSDEELALVLGVDPLMAGRGLDRLVHWHLAVRDLDRGRAIQHPLLREAAHAMARHDTKGWTSLRAGVARMLRSRTAWACAPISEDRIAEAFARWLHVRDLFVTSDWSGSDRGPGDIDLGWAVLLANTFLQFELGNNERLQRIDHALSSAGNTEPELRAGLLQARGDLRRFQDDLNGAADDYAAALLLFLAVEDKLGQANVLQARGDLVASSGDFEAAMNWYSQALPLYESVDDRVGMSNVLTEVARVHAASGNLDDAEETALAATKLGVQAHNQYAVGTSKKLLEYIATARSRSGGA